MCGIAGSLTWGAHSTAEALLGSTTRMTHALRHRGPDDQGVWTEPSLGLGLGHSRLSILDLSPEGRQPKASPHGRFVIVFNGEIYNYRELRADLLSRGHRFRGTSDTEVMLAAFEEHGFDKALRLFNGMFAFALWDREKRLLYLACDRLGEKPLYYTTMGGWLLFGSEIKSLRQHPAFTGAIDRDALAAYLQFGYVPAPFSIYEGVRKLEPAHYLVIDPAGQELASHAYWSGAEVAAAGQANPFRGGIEEAIEGLDQCLRRSIQARMVADVPLGAFLSGGVDSSTIVALMQKATNRQVRTFTIGLAEAGYNEALDASSVARHLGTEHTEHYVTAGDAMAVIPRLGAIYDEPFADSSQIPTLLVSQLARQNVTVALSGDGGDELFGGYNRHLWAARLWRRTQRIPLPLRNMIQGSLNCLGPRQWDWLAQALGPVLPGWCQVRQPGDKLQKLVSAMSSDSAPNMYGNLVSQWPDPTALVLGSRPIATRIGDAAHWPSSLSFSEQMMLLDLLTYLPGDILVKVDRAAMSVGLETRVPFLDPELIEFAWKLPLSWKIRQGQGKWLLRQVLYRYVPQALVDRPKSGFGIPLDGWLRGPLREWASDLLDAGTMSRQGYLDPAPIQERWREHLKGTRNHQHPLWTILMFQAWLQELESQSGCEDASAVAHC